MWQIKGHFVPDGVSRRRALIAAVFLAVLAGLPGSIAATKKAQLAAESDLFDGTNIVKISITIPEDGIRRLGQTPWQPGNQDRPQVRATVSDGTRTYKDVALHLKGAAGSFRPINDRPGMTLNFDKFVKGQNFHGIEKLSLNNSVQDPSYIMEKFSRELYLKAGVPVPRTDYALVTLNGRNLGLYVLAEGFNKQFLGQHFKKTGGNLYDGGFCQEVTQDLSLNSGDPKDQSDLERLRSALQKTSQSNKLSDLAEALDVDRFVSMLAMDILLCHWDGYALNKNNYRIYGDPEIGKMVFIPHGLDQVFNQGRGNHPDIAINAHMNGIVARRLVGTREGRALYMKRIGELRTNLFQSGPMIARVREIEARLQPVVPSKASHRLAVNELCRMIQVRDEDLDRQLSSPARELPFDSKGIATIEGWKPRKAVSASEYHPVNGPDGKKYLQIIGNGGDTSASWRTRVMLVTGRYRFEGMVRTKNAERHGSGVKLRISGARDVQPVQADARWTKCSYEFEIEEAIADVELVCEVRPAAGEVWFDAGSLRIVKLSNNE
jgi:spore coat protein H